MFIEHLQSRRHWNAIWGEVKSISLDMRIISKGDRWVIKDIGGEVGEGAKEVQNLNHM